MKNRLIRVIVCALLGLSFLVTAYATTILPYADPEFKTASLSLSSNKEVIFSATTNETKNKIYVAACWLEVKSGEKWIKVCNLTRPSLVLENIHAYSTVMDYSDSIVGSGTFRVAGTFWADGYTITRYSNEKTFY